MADFATRDQLLLELSELDAEVPEMRRLFRDPGDFIGEFALRAELICDLAHAVDAQWLFDRLDATLARHGVAEKNSIGIRESW